MDVIPKKDLFRNLGYGGDPAVVEPLLEDAGLSKPKKTKIAAKKSEEVAELLAQHFILVCGRGDCHRSANKIAGGRQVAPAATEAACDICGGSANQKAIDEMVAAYKAQGWDHLVVVGGSPNARAAFEAGVGGRIELRLISGTARRTKTDAVKDIEWADRVVIWGGTQLNHKVSALYSGPKVSAVGRRSIQAVCDEVVRVCRGERKGS